MANFAEHHFELGCSNSDPSAAWNCRQGPERRFVIGYCSETGEIARRLANTERVDWILDYATGWLMPGLFTTGAPC